MLVDLELKMIADKNGHLCPDLAIGWRVGLVARKIIQRGGEIVAGCMSCAVVALNDMGPWHLKVDAVQGRHKYQIRSNQGVHVILDVNERFTWPGGDFAVLEQRVSRHEATLEEVAVYQRQIDEQVHRILAATDAKLFSWTDVDCFAGHVCIGSA